MPITLNPGDIRELSVQMTPVYVPPEKATLYGQVTDVDTGLGIPGVHVTLEGTGGTYGGYTDSQGNYQIPDIEPSTYTVTFTHADYQTIVI